MAPPYGDFVWGISGLGIYSCTQLFCIRRIEIDLNMVKSYDNNNAHQSPQDKLAKTMFIWKREGLSL